MSCTILLSAKKFSYLLKQKVTRITASFSFPNPIVIRDGDLLKMYLKFKLRENKKGDQMVAFLFSAKSD